MSHITIRHPSERDAESLFRYYYQKSVLHPLCREADADVPLGIQNRNQALVERVVDRVYNAARAWKRSIPETVSYSDTLPSELGGGLLVTQKANHLFHNHMKTSVGRRAGQDYFARLQVKFDSEQEMAQFFRDFDKTSSQISTTFKNDCLSLQYQDLDEVPSNIADKAALKHLDFSYNRMGSYQDYRAFSNAISLDLSHNGLVEVPLKLPPQLTELRLRGNSIYRLSSFEGLDKLTLLDISYNKNIYFDPLFFMQVKKIKVVISPDTNVSVPAFAREKFTFVSSFDEAQVFPMDSDGKVQTSVPELDRAAQTKFSIWKWLGIAAVLGAIGYAISKLWARTRSA